MVRVRYTEMLLLRACNNTLTLPNEGTIISKDSNGAVGVTSVTVGTGVTIGDGRATATTFHGSGANLMDWFVFWLCTYGRGNRAWSHCTH